MVEETFYGIYEGESHQRHQGESRPDMTSRIDWGQERRGVGRETNKRGDKGREKSQEDKENTHRENETNSTWPRRLGF